MRPQGWGESAEEKKTARGIRARDLPPAPGAHMLRSGRKLGHREGRRLAGVGGRCTGHLPCCRMTHRLRPRRVRSEQRMREQLR
ncbi:hypothetical protein C0Q70_03741 [Pomacea canaliculata]|uniref:Uncharacterized protein n=1 Tax=Pomacea canaliculata TaxID=400727 RepID=A0A2T7PTJ7_POMCA|nr:hypothetical protein C0Q70_03741 [Pomacea canaliculata]